MISPLFCSMCSSMSLVESLISIVPELFLDLTIICKGRLPLPGRDSSFCSARHLEQFTFWLYLNHMILNYPSSPTPLPHITWTNLPHMLQLWLWPHGSSQTQQFGTSDILKCFKITLHDRDIKYLNFYFYLISWNRH